MQAQDELCRDIIDYALHFVERRCWSLAARHLLPPGRFAACLSRDDRTRRQSQQDAKFEWEALLAGIPVVVAGVVVVAVVVVVVVGVVATSIYIYSQLPPTTREGARWHLVSGRGADAPHQTNWGQGE